MTVVTQMSEILEEELIYGARRRERVWKVLAGLGLTFGVVGCLSAAAVAMHAWVLQHVEFPG